MDWGHYRVLAAEGIVPVEHVGFQPPEMPDNGQHTVRYTELSPMRFKVFGGSSFYTQR
jgi:hypothetical protein